jgi:hypothetical protein
MYEELSLLFSYQSYSGFYVFSVILSVVGMGILTRLIVGHDDEYGMTEEELERARNWSHHLHDDPPKRFDIPDDAWPDPQSSPLEKENQNE